MCSAQQALSEDVKATNLLLLITVGQTIQENEVVEATVEKAISVFSLEESGSQRLLMPRLLLSFSFL